MTTTLARTQLKATQLTRHIDVNQLPASTKRLNQSDIFLGQQRAKQALEFMVNMPFNDYHLCAVGTIGLGKRYKITQFLQQWVAQHPQNLHDYLFVYHFQHKQQPILLQLQQGQATVFIQQLALHWLNIIATLKQNIFLTAQEIQHILQPYFTEFHKNISPLVTHDSQQDFQTYLCGLIEYISFYARDILFYLKNDYVLQAHTILEALPREYHIHVLIHHPVKHTIIYEPNPTLQRLFGHVSELTQTTIKTEQGEHLSYDFQIQSGSLLQANGGFLILDLKQCIQNVEVWYLLKQCLKTRQWDWKNIQKTAQIPHQNLQLTVIPLQLKVILLCDADEFDEVLALDNELATLFKIRVDFNDSLTRTSEHEFAYLQRVADLVNQHNLLSFDRSALAEVLTESSRQAEDQNLLTLHDGQLRDLLRESHYYAQQNNSPKVTAYHVQTALKQRHYRLGYWRDLYWQDLSQGTQLIETKGVRLGQVNALSVVHFADTEFGFPSRLTASVSQGAGDILDIERSVELGGSLHAKGTLLMSSFLKSHFGRQQILNFSAALAFEQNYGEVDGDSATVAELCALISAIGQIPILQSWAITGSMNQLGQVQPVGGINAKIEGFFDACVLQGLTGQQGVIIPRLNTQHLMLRPDIIQAVEQGQFHIHAIDNVEQALELLMARPIGEFDAKKGYSKDSIYEAVLQQLANWQDEELTEEEEPKKKKKTKK